MSAKSPTASVVITNPPKSEEALPTQCYICQTKFSATVHSVLQLCDCRVAVCQQCAINRMVLNDEFALDCQVCGSKVDSSVHTGIIRNAQKVKELADKYIERASRFFRLPVPSVVDPTVSQFYPLLSRFGRMEGLSQHLSGLLVNNEQKDSEGVVSTQRKKLNVNLVKLTLARVEHLRAGPLKEIQEMTEPMGNITIEEREGSLPLGPLKLLHLTKNVYLERLLALSGCDCCGGNNSEIDTSCVTCHNQIRPGESVLLSCSCEVLICRGCAVRGFISSKYTYRKGISCPSCSKNSMISFGNIEKAKEEEESILAVMVRQYSTAGVTYCSKSILDLRKLLEHLNSAGIAPPPLKPKEVTDHLSFHQIELELSRIYVALERKKSRHERLVKKEKKSVVKKLHSGKEEGKEAEFNEDEMKGKKGAGAKKKKGDKEGELEFDQIVVYDNKADENYLYEASERDVGYDLPIGPLRLLRFKKNPYVEMYLANTSQEEDESHLSPQEKEVADMIKRDRFNVFKPKFNTMCPKCTLNPQSLECIRSHLRTTHEITRKDEIDKFMNQVVLQPVADHIIPLVPMKGRVEHVTPPMAPIGRPDSSKLHDVSRLTKMVGIFLSNESQSLTSVALELGVLSRTVFLVLAPHVSSSKVPLCYL